MARSSSLDERPDRIRRATTELRVTQIIGRSIPSLVEASIVRTNIDDGSGRPCRLMPGGGGPELARLTRKNREPAVRHASRNQQSNHHYRCCARLNQATTNHLSHLTNRLCQMSDRYFIIFAIARHSFAQFRQDLAQATICSSSGNFSHAAAQSSQHFAQHSHA